MKKQALALATIFTLSAGGFASNAFAAEHTIQPGETLGGISKQYSMTVDELKTLNDLTSDLILANDTLTVIGEDDFYTIQPGDTLHEIGLSKSATVDQLMNWNNLTSDLIYAGDKLAVTEAAGKATATTTNTSTQAAATTKNSTQQAASTESQATQATQKQQSNTTATATASKTITVVATAYTASCSGCSGITANGTDLNANPNARVIAVDPSVIPLGTKVWVEGYGEAIAADTGGAIKGNKIDVYVKTNSEAYAWGRKTVTVKILN